MLSKMNSWSLLVLENRRLRGIWRNMSKTGPCFQVKLSS